MAERSDKTTQCFRDTIIAYRDFRRIGELHLPAFRAALEVYKQYQENNPNAGRTVQNFIVTAAEMQPEWFGKARDIHD